MASLRGMHVMSSSPTFVFTHQQFILETNQNVVKRYPEK